jgi:lysine-ketoglutarate reductase/saccharopine dehydrogenase-like protein (TIGR00300 family)
LIAEGHLVDSGILTRILNLIVEEGADYRILSFRMGRTNLDVSYLELEVLGEPPVLSLLIPQLINLGCYEQDAAEALLRPAPADGVAPDDFYSTTNHRTQIFLHGDWRDVLHQRMDAVIVVHGAVPTCHKLRELRRGEAVVCGSGSVRLLPQPRERETGAFGFMASDVSSERSVEAAAARIAAILWEEKARAGRVIAVPGPVVVHTGGGESFAALIRGGYIHGVLSGNALAVHDAESVFFGTSLGVDLRTGKATYEGHRNHMRAINRIRSFGSIQRAVEAGALTSGIMAELVRGEIPYVLAGSIRDDGPLPGVVTDIIEAQNQYARMLEGATVVLMLSSMLHSIAVGNMIPSWVRTVCVDINPAVVTKLADRGSAQTVGIVTDVGLFLRALAGRLGCAPGRAEPDERRPPRP